MKKVLLVGESWEVFSIHLKGFDAFFTTKYDEGAKWLIEALEEGGYQVDYIPNHHAPSKVPTDLAKLKEYSAVILSDIGANTLLLHPDTFERSIATPNRLKLFREYVEQGGAFVMIGGYMSFTGIDGKAKYKNSPVEEILPVTLLAHDDRVEIPEGVYPEVSKPDHPVVQGLDAQWPMLLGYNQVIAKEGRKFWPWQARIPFWWWVPTARARPRPSPRTARPIGVPRSSWSGSSTTSSGSSWWTGSLIRSSRDNLCDAKRHARGFPGRGLSHLRE